MEFERHWSEMDTHVDMSPYESFYKQALSLVKGETFVELGVREGVSARMIMDYLDRTRDETKPWYLWLIDSHHNHNVDELARYDNVNYILDTAESAVNLFTPNRIDFLHIDLNPHTYEQTKEIFGLYEPKLGKNCVVVFHDCRPEWGVWDFVHKELKPQPEWVVEFCTTDPRTPWTAPAMATRIR